MKKSKFSEAQIAFILRQADEGTPVAEVCRKAGISDATFYNWRKRYGGLTPSEVKRMRQLEDENNRLKKIVADLTLDKAMLQDVLSKNLFPNSFFGHEARFQKDLQNADRLFRHHFRALQSVPVITGLGLRSGGRLGRLDV
jgi:putative transposase